MKFLELSLSFEKIESERSRIVMTKLLAELLKKVTPEEAAIICTMSLGDIYPSYIGTQFNIAEKTIIKVIAQLLDINQEIVISQKKKFGDLGLIVQQGTWKHADDLAVIDVYNQLVALEKMSGVGSQEAKQAFLLQLLQSLDPLSAKYVIRIIIGKLRLGFSEMTLIDALSWMECGDKQFSDIIENAYNIRADIGLIAKKLKQDGIDTLKNMTIVVGIPIRPAAAERLSTAEAIIKKIGPCIAQPKLDGFRLQIHVNNGNDTPRIHFYSRNLQDMSAMFPDIHKAIALLPVKNMIIEGEAIVYDEYTHTFLPFQETVKRKRKHDIEEMMAQLPLHVFVFDLLYLNGVSYLHETQRTRREVLISLFEFEDAKQAVISLIEEKDISNVQMLQDYFMQTVTAGLEGLVVKRPDSTYQPGKRNFNWIKLKRHEEGHLDDTIDVVILGYYAGSGKRANFGIGAFLVGVYNPEKDQFETVAKVGTGLKDEDWKELKKRCDTLIALEQPKNVICSKELYPDVWVLPEIVCIVRADEITRSPLHTAGKTAHAVGYALRFPRFIDYRIDKKEYEATTAQEIISLYKVQFE